LLSWFDSRGSEGAELSSVPVAQRLAEVRHGTAGFCDF
jgi:hypothetical protein